MPNKKTSTKTTKNSALSGINNKSYHQYILSDLIFGVRKKLTRDGKASTYLPLTELSIKSELGYDTLLKNHNIDFLVIHEAKQEVVLIAEIERTGQIQDSTLEKIKDCLLKITTIEEAFLITFDYRKKVIFELCTLDKKKNLVRTVVKRSEFLDYTLSRCLTSLKM